MSETPHLDELGCPTDINEINEVYGMISVII